MKLIKNYKMRDVVFSSQGLNIGEMMEVTEPGYGYTSHVILRTYVGYVSLNNPEMTWGLRLNIMGRKLNPGESVTLVQE
jgi:hypothetical protein